MTPLRVGCVGGGFIAGRHCTALSGIPGVQIVAVADTDRPRAEAAVARYGGRAYDDGLALLASEDLDAVWLCVPPFAHGPLEVTAIERGLPFFVEKPIALDVGTAVTVEQRIRDRGLLTAVGYHWRHLRVVERAAQALRGRPVQLALGHWLDGTPAVPWWCQRNRSGGQLLEQSTHLFDLLRLLVGEVESVVAMEATIPRAGFPGADVPTTSTVILRFASGAIGAISSACLLDRRRRVDVQLVAEGATVEVSERSLSDHALRIDVGDGELVTQSDEDPIAREDAEFIHVLQGRADRVRVPYQEALRSHLLACAADRSARDDGRLRTAAETEDETVRAGGGGGRGG